MASDSSQSDLHRGIQDHFQNLPPADWVQDMVKHYHRTGSYRPQDLRRLLGDPNQAVEVGPNATLPAFFTPRPGKQD